MQFIPTLAFNGPGIALGVVLGLATGVAGVMVLGRLWGIRLLGEARRQADQRLEKAREEAETQRKQLELDAREEISERRKSFDQEAEQTRDELKQTERRLNKREDNLDRKLDTLSTKEKHLGEREKNVAQREHTVQGREEELDGLVHKQQRIVEESEQQQKQTLLRISNLSEEDARKQAIKVVERESRHEAAQIIQRNLEQAEQQSQEQARNIILQAIQRYAGEHTADTTVSTITIPSDDMKGRVIGREGRNIRAFEKATGVDVIVDDTPGVVVVSCFDPVRRAIASESLNKLLEDGRIHPTRIEEVVTQMRDQIHEQVIRYGQDACIEVNVQGLAPRLSEMMGRLHYRMSFGQNILRHSVEVAYLAQVIADELGLDGAMARRCGFLHDIGKAMDHEMEGGHPAIGMEFARKHGEPEAVLNAIGGHHNDLPATTPYTAIVMAADAISGARPGARRETLEKYIQRLEQLETIAKQMKGVQQAYAIQAGREVRVTVDPDKVHDGDCTYLARDIAKRVTDEVTYPGEIKVTVLREMRTIEYAR